MSGAKAAKAVADITNRTVLVNGGAIDKALGMIRNSMRDSGLLDQLKRRRRFITPTQRRHIFAFKSKANMVERSTNEKLKVILNEFNK